jgi:hypothetical protein
MRHANKVLAGVVVVILLLAAYVGGYFGLCYRLEVVRDGKPDDIIRLYAHPWESTVFRPAGWLESKLIGVGVEIADDENPPFQDTGPAFQWWF